MHIVVKSGLAVSVAAGGGGLGYGIYNAVRTPTYAEVLKGTLLSTNKDEDQDKWKLRLASLKTAEKETLIIALKAIKEAKPDANADQLISWCKAIIDTSNKGEKDQEFQNIQSYCTFSVNEKLTNHIPAGTEKSDDRWEKAHKAIKTIETEDLDEELTKAKTKTAQEAKDTVHDWCTETYKKPYKGPNDKDFKNASIVCLIRN